MHTIFMPACTVLQTVIIFIKLNILNVLILFGLHKFQKIVTKNYNTLLTEYKAHLSRNHFFFLTVQLKIKLFKVLCQKGSHTT